MKICTKCGARMSDSNRFCEKCGSTLVTETAAGHTAVPVRSETSLSQLVGWRWCCFSARCSWSPARASR